MLKITVTELKGRLDEYFVEAETEAITIIHPTGKSIVMLSIEEYERLQALDDADWGERAKKASEEGYVSMEETGRWLAERLNEAT
jgi:PHD/YefM family antitoxin component YafN of YafNO toxin-antitoxin module